MILVPIPKFSLRRFLPLSLSLQGEILQTHALNRVVLMEIPKPLGNLSPLIIYALKNSQIWIKTNAYHLLYLHDTPFNHDAFLHT